MRGLLVKDAQLLKVNIKPFFGIFLVAVIFLVASKSGSTFFVPYLAMLASFLILNTVSYDDFDNGMAYLMTLPVSRKLYVMEKYVFGMAIGWSCVAAAALLGTVSNAFRFPELNGSPEWSAVILVSFLMVWIISVLMLPVQIKLGSENSRFVLMIIFVVIIGAAYGIVYVGKRLGVDFEAAAGNLLSMSRPLLALIGLVVMFLSLAASAAVSIRFLEKKEF